MRVRLLAILVLASLVFTALAAVWTLIFGEFGETAARVLGTSASVAGYSLLAMAGAAAFGRAKSLLVRSAGGLAILCSLMAFVASILLIWAEEFHDEGMFKTWAVASVAALALALIVLLDRIRLPVSRRWLRFLTVAMILVLAALIDVPVILLDEQSEALGRTVGVVSVLVALGILTMPIVAWQAAREGRASAVLPPRAGHVRLTCPSCGKLMDVPTGRSGCTGCSQGFEITLFQDGDTA